MLTPKAYYARRNTNEAASQAALYQRGTFPWLSTHGVVRLVTSHDIHDVTTQQLSTVLLGAHLM